MIALKLHPQSVCAAIRGIEVELARSRQGELVLCYSVTGLIGDLLLPALSAPIRTDGLWQHSCFEAFTRGSGESYREYNFAPSTQWAAYDFSGYRDGMIDAAVAAPTIETTIAADRFELRAAFEIDPAVTRIALSAVIEEANGRKSYWALAHPPGQPDFHHGDCFALELPDS